jgi:hypothetical protein
MARASIVIVQAGSGYALGGGADIQIVQSAIRFVQAGLRVICAGSVRGLPGVRRGIE